MAQNILIVGATSGLGRKLAELYSLQGCKVGIVGRRNNLLKELSQLYPDNIVPLQLDISDPNAERIISDFIESLNGIDTLILAASIVKFNPELLPGIEKEMIRTNVEGYTSVLNAAYHYFISKNNGHIVCITSIAAARGNNSTPAYNATKAFQSSYIESLRLKLLSTGSNIHVTELIPGYIDTQMAMGERLFWVADVDKAARQAKAAIDRKVIRAFITRRWQLVYYLYKLLPAYIYTRIINSKLTLQKRK